MIDNLIWQSTNNIIMYSYNNGHTWLNLLHNKDSDALIPICIQILRDPRVTTTEADLIFEYVDELGLTIDLIMKIDYLAYGYHIEIENFDKLFKTDVLRSALISPKIRELIVKSPYLIERILSNKDINFKHYKDFINTAIRTQLKYFVNKTELLNDLLDFLEIELLNEICDTIGSKIDELIKFFKPMRETSTIAVQFLSQDKWLKQPTNTLLFKRMIAEVSLYAKLFFATPAGNTLILNSVTQQEWINILANDISIGAILLNINSTSVVNIIFNIPEWLKIISIKPASSFTTLITNLTLVNFIANSSDLMRTMAMTSQSIILSELVNYKKAMNIISNSSVAMNAITNSRTAIDLLANSTTGMTIVAKSTIAMTAITNSNIGMTAVYSSGIARAQIENSNIAIDVLKTKAKIVVTESIGMGEGRRFYYGPAFLIYKTTNTINTGTGNESRFVNNTTDNVNSLTPHYINRFLAQQSWYSNTSEENKNMTLYVYKW